MRKIIAPKGYTLKVRSWENDADNIKTESVTVETLEEAQAYLELVKLCRSKNRDKGCLGNLYDWNESSIETAAKFVKNHPILFPGYQKEPDQWTDEELTDLFTEAASEVLGYSSDEYIIRVSDKWELTYNPEDIYAEVIESTWN